MDGIVSCDQRSRKTNLVAIGMPADDDGFVPACNESRNVLADDWLPEHRPAQDVANRAVRTAPHPFQLELYKHNAV